MRSRRYLWLPLVIIVAFASAPAASADAGTPAAPRPAVVTAAAYARAERYLPWNAAPLAYGLHLVPHWLRGGRFWYRLRTPSGLRFMLIDPERKTRSPLWDAGRIAAALSAASGEALSPGDLHPSQLSLSDGGSRVSFTQGRQRWRCTREGARCVRLPPPLAVSIPPSGPPVSISPDGTKAVFIRNWNLWLRNLATGAVEPLTQDGIKNFGYATDNAGWTSSDRPIVLWSPDSTKIATYQQDQRGVGRMYLVPAVVGHPKLVTEVYPLPGDKVVTTIQRVIVDLHGPDGKPAVVRLHMPPDQHRSTLRDDLAFGLNEDVQWSPDGKTLAFISTSRGHKHEWVRVANAATGGVRTVYEDTVPTEYEGGEGGGNFRYLPEAGEFLWYSQKHNFGELELRSLQDGRLIRRVTRDVGNVDHVVYLDREAREVYFIATAGPHDINPYYQQLYRASLDHPGAQLLTPEPANHNVSFSPNGRYFTDTYSTPDAPPVTVLRTANGQLVMRLEQADVSRLLAAGWKPPVEIEVKARDGFTDLYGLMFTPFHLEPGRRYPILNHIYPGPQIGSVGTWNFLPAHGDDEALAQLGFVVVEINGMGTPWRGRIFHDAYYGNMKDNTLPDQVAGMKQLARKYPFIDMDRAGIWGHSGGGYAAVDAMFTYPGFFKAGVAESGNYDPREYEDDWAERYMGLVRPAGGGKTNYSGQAIQDMAKNLQGHLLLATGTMDGNVPMNNTLLVVQALIQANKNFGLILFPNQGHGYGPDEPYMIRRRWDFFVRYLLDAKPPRGFRIEGPAA